MTPDKELPKPSETQIPESFKEEREEPPNYYDVPETATPEIPKGGITVEYRQPAVLHYIAKGIAEQPDNFNFVQVSNTYFMDTLIAEEDTEIASIVLHGEDNDPTGKTFCYQSVIHLSDEKVHGPDEGYYSHEKVDTILDLLEQKGVQAVVDHTSSGGRSFIIIAQDGSYIEICFGLPNREAALAELKDAEIIDILKDKLLSQIDDRRITISLVDEERERTGKERYPLLKDRADFTRATAAYCQAYQDILEALYEAEGIEQPGRTIVIRPPILNEDTLTSIKSIETPRPTMVTPEQVLPKGVSFEEIAGQEYAVAEAKKLVRAINDPETLRKRGAEKPKGVLLYGPPGTGKTMIAEAIAHEADAVFLSISSNDIGSKWYGESEQLMQKVFDQANQAVARGKKVIIFFDELDALAPSRDGAHEATRKVVSIILQNMDGFKANPHVTVLAATNRPQDIDEALRRPGRFDKKIFVGLPSVEGRIAILSVHMKKAQERAAGPDELFSPDIDFSKVGKATEGLSGADLANLVNLTLEKKAYAELEGEAWVPVTTEELLGMAKTLGMIAEENRRIGFAPEE
ncbi:AAA family ATPase [Candidatus Roizmanbacteria bacterium]|nr:AAA family ATPase [Candidatus Roizmanbacteria bacterium]